MFVVVVDYREAPNIMDELTKVLSLLLSHVVVCCRCRLRTLAQFRSSGNPPEAMDAISSNLYPEYNRSLGGIKG